MRYSSIEKKCVVCSSNFTVQQYRKDQARYCSRKCKCLDFRGKPNGAKGIKHLTMYGENNHKWVEDRSKLQQYSDSTKDRRSYAYTYWRRKVLSRDGFKCKIADENCSGRLEVHHILGWNDNPELRYKINNGITLCHAHHPYKRAEEKRLESYFMELVSVSR